MKKAAYVLVIVLLLLSGCSKSIIEEDINEVDFGFDSYSEEFTCQKIVGRKVIFDDISTPEKLAENVEKIWIEVYGKKIIEQRPYIINFDENRQLWMLTGNSAYLEDGCGGVAYAIVDNKTGELLYIYHDE